jgi:hypothetical protein
MSLNLDTYSIASVAYRTSITDRSVIRALIKKDIPYVENKSKEFSSLLENSIDESEPRTRNSNTRVEISSRQTNKIWETNKTYRDTSSSYHRPYVHMGLRSRISRNSGGSLPKEIACLTSEQIESTDSNAIKSYTTVGRGIRKCSLTVFAACAKLAGSDIGLFKDCEKRPYSCKSISLSVKELSKNTHAGTDTLGKKNDEKVQKRVIDQLRDILRHPTSHKVISKNPVLAGDQRLLNLYTLPELIFHRFQATYDAELGICNEKSRIVWCVSYTIIALENFFIGNIIKSVKRKCLLSEEAIYPIGLTNYQIGQRSVGTLRDKFKVIGKGKYKIYSLDFKMFDATIPIWAKDLFFSLIKPVINLTFNQSDVFDFLRIYIKHTPFVRGSEVLFKERGISSGLLITNLFDTWWNLTIHYFVKIILELYHENIDDIFTKEMTFDKIFMDKSKVKNNIIIDKPLVRVLGDDSIILCDEFTLELHRKVCLLLGMNVTIKHVTSDPYDPIFFLGRYWNASNRPFQSEEYMALRICYTKWFNEKNIPFSRHDIHLNRMLSICLPLIGGKEFLDKYLFDYEPYNRFNKSKEGFIYMKDFIEENFRYMDYSKALQVDSY